MFICVPRPVAPLTATGCKSDVCLNLAKTFEFVIPIDAPYAHIVCSTVAETFALARGVQHQHVLMLSVKVCLKDCIQILLYNPTIQHHLSLSVILCNCQHHRSNNNPRTRGDFFYRSNHGITQPHTRWGLCISSDIQTHRHKLDSHRPTTGNT